MPGADGDGLAINEVVNKDDLTIEVGDREPAVVPLNSLPQLGIPMLSMRALFSTVATNYLDSVRR